MNGVFFITSPLLIGLFNFCCCKYKQLDNPLFQNLMNLHLAQKPSLLRMFNRMTNLEFCTLPRFCQIVVGCRVFFISLLFLCLSI